MKKFSLSILDDLQLTIKLLKKRVKELEKENAQLRDEVKTAFEDGAADERESNSMATWEI